MSWSVGSIVSSLINFTSGSFCSGLDLWECAWKLGGVQGSWCLAGTSSQCGVHFENQSLWAVFLLLAQRKLVVERSFSDRLCNIVNITWTFFDFSIWRLFLLSRQACQVGGNVLPPLGVSLSSQACRRPRYVTEQSPPSILNPCWLFYNYLAAQKILQYLSLCG